MDDKKRTSRPSRRDILKFFTAFGALNFWQKLSLAFTAWFSSKALAQIIPHGFWRKRSSSNDSFGGPGIYVWGDNSYGSLGLGHSNDVNSPTLLPGDYDEFRTFDGTYSYFKKPDGSYWVCGYNGYGNLGQGNTIHRSSPVQFAGTWTYLFCSGTTYGIRPNGTLWGCGSNSQDRLELGSADPVSSPVQIGSQSWIQANNTYRLRQDNTLWENRSDGNQIPGSWASIEHNHMHYFGIQTNGALWAWGANWGAGLGINLVNESPNQIAGSWLDASLGLAHAAAIKSDNTLWVWGVNDYGQLGTNNTTSVYSQTQITGTWSKVSCGPEMTAAIRSNGTLWLWGKNQYGELGQGDKDPRSSPVQLAGSWTQIASSARSSYPFCLAIKTNGTLWAWGRGEEGVLAQGHIGSRSSPVQIAGSWTQVVAGPTEVFGIQTNGTLWAWGKNDKGQLGQGDRVSRSSPVQIPGSWIQVSAPRMVHFNYMNAVAVRSDSTLWAWGEGGYGQLGQGNKTSYSSPVQIPGTWIKALSGPGTNNFGIRSDNSVWAVGYNFSTYHGYTFGMETPVGYYSSPVQVSSWKTIQSVARSSQGRTLGIKQDNSLWIWGTYYTDLGIGPYWSSPVQIPGSWTQVAAGPLHGLAIRTDGTLWSWGSSGHGALGTPITTNYCGSPVQIPGSWTAVGATNGISFAYRADNTLWLWGNNQDQKLGIPGATDLSYSSPVQMPGTWSSFSAYFDGGSQYSLGGKKLN